MKPILTFANCLRSMIALVAMLLGIPFAAAGFMVQFAIAAFETGRGAAAITSRWISDK